MSGPAPEPPESVACSATRCLHALGEHTPPRLCVTLVVIVFLPMSRHTRRTKPVTVTSLRQAAAVCNVTPPVIRRWLSLGLIPGPPWTLQQLHHIRDETDPQGRRRGPQVPHGTLTGWLEGCDCAQCREAQNDAANARFRRPAQKRLPAQVRQQLLDAIYSGQPFRTMLPDLGLTSNQVWD
jgi:hypothetical protein